MVQLYRSLDVVVFFLWMVDIIILCLYLYRFTTSYIGLICDILFVTPFLFFCRIFYEIGGPNTAWSFPYAKPAHPKRHCTQQQSTAYAENRISSSVFAREKRTNFVTWSRNETKKKNETPMETNISTSSHSHHNKKIVKLLLHPPTKQLTLNESSSIK